MLLFVCVSLAAGTVGAAACLGVGVGAGTLKFLLLMEKHLNPQSGHHQSEDAHCNGKNYEYCLHFKKKTPMAAEYCAWSQKYFGMLCRLPLCESSVAFGGGLEGFFCGITLIVLAACDHALVRCETLFHPYQAEAQHRVAIAFSHEGKGTVDVLVGRH